MCLRAQVQLRTYGVLEALRFNNDTVVVGVAASARNCAGPPPQPLEHRQQLPKVRLAELLPVFTVLFGFQNKINILDWVVDPALILRRMGIFYQLRNASRRT